MSHTAKELLFDWLSQSTKIEVTEDSLAKYQLVIDQLLLLNEESSKDFWFDLLKLHLSVIDETHDSAVRLANKIREFKTDFPLSKNFNLLHVISSSAIAQKLDKNNELICDSLALAIINSNFRVIEHPKLGIELLERAVNFYYNECESIRKLSSVDTLKTTLAALKMESTFKDYDIETANYNAPSHSSVQLAFKQTKKDLESLGKDLDKISLELNKFVKKIVADINTAISTTEKRDEIIKEEMDVLWWITASYSDLFESALSDLSIFNLPLAIASELDKVTIYKPGLGRVDSIISKAISYHADQKNKYKLDTVIDHFTKDNPLATDFFKFNMALVDFCPLLFALKCRLDFPNENEWKIMFKKRYNYLVLADLDAFEISKQLYREIQLRKSF